MSRRVLAHESPPSTFLSMSSGPTPDLKDQVANAASAVHTEAANEAAHEARTAARASQWPLAIFALMAFVATVVISWPSLVSRAPAALPSHTDVTALLAFTESHITTFSDSVGRLPRDLEEVGLHDLPVDYRPQTARYRLAALVVTDSVVVEIPLPARHP